MTEPGLAADARRTEFLEVPVGLCRHSRFNTRKTRPPEQIERLAQRIARLGFERTRAVWAVQAPDGFYEVFAGGTRLEAARRAGLETIPVILHVGYTDDEISRRSDEDNENDEYHTPVSPVDVWAEYHRLATEEGWTQERIAGVKGVSQALVSMRIRLHQLPEAVKVFIRDGLLTEAHLLEITQGISRLIPALAPWLTAEQAWTELAAQAVRDKQKNGGKSVAALREDVKGWKEFIAYAERVYQDLPEVVTLYDFTTNAAEPTPVTFRPREAFVQELARRTARSLPAVLAAERQVRRHITENLDVYQRWVENRNRELAERAARAERVAALLAKFHHGDAIEALRSWSGRTIRLLLTDPPYGVAYQSNRRWRSAPPDKIVGDTADEAGRLLAAMLAAVIEHLADDAHVLVFTSPEREPETRAILAAAGLTWKGQLIWVKDEHTAGDLDGSFAPDHDVILHYVKGRPRVSPRHRQTFIVPRSRETSHPAEKPIALLRTLIECTTAEGDLVVDPFAGCASTLVAALRCGRDFWGAEIDAAYYDEGCRRLLRELERQ
jgi:ParB/RepB/Spo0J family partition protein